MTASSVAEAKDAELERVLASNARLRQDLASLQHVRMVPASHPSLPVTCSDIMLDVNYNRGVAQTIHCKLQLCLHQAPLGLAK